MGKFLGSVRSQRSILEEHRLRQDLERCEGIIIHFSKQVADFEKVVEYQTKLAVSGDGMADMYLHARIVDLQSYKVQLTAYETFRASIQAKIDGLTSANPSQLQKRADEQNRICDLARRRLEIDHQADFTLRELLRLLADRRDITSLMAETGGAIDFNWDVDGLDEARFKALLDALPRSLSPASEKWVRWFLGEEREKKSLTTCERIVLPETLSSPNVFNSGDSIEMTEEQALRLSGKVRSQAETQEAGRSKVCAQSGASS